MADIYSIIEERIRTGADCDCCGHYDDRVYNLSCGHQLCEYTKYEELTEIRCPECSGDYDEDEVLYLKEKEGNTSSLLTPTSLTKRCEHPSDDVVM